MITEKTVYEVEGKVFTDLNEAKRFEVKIKDLQSIGLDSLREDQIYYIIGYNFWDYFSDAGDEFQDKGLLKLCYERSYITDNRKVFVFSEYSTGSYYKCSISSEEFMTAFLNYLEESPEKLYEFDY